MSGIPVRTVVNGIGAAAAAIVVGWAVLSMLESDQATVCEGRYASATRFSLADETGGALSSSGLQAHVGAGEWGVIENSAIVEGSSGASARHVLEVAIEKGTGSGHQDNLSRGGIGFAWMPFDMQEAAPDRACLSYRIRLPEDFDFGTAGTLPGLFLGSDFDPRGEPQAGLGAAARPGWHKGGAIGVRLQYAGNGAWQNPLAVPTKSAWPRGRWTAIDQEIILNEIGKKNGVVRLWIDGELVGENMKLGLRGDPALAMAGVLADVHYGAIGSAAAAPQDAKIQISPFVIRWK